MREASSESPYEAFVLKFQKLKLALGGDSAPLRAETILDKSVAQLAAQVSLHASVVEQVIAGSSAYVAGLSPWFIEEWREYKKEYAREVARILSAEMGIMFVHLADAGDRSDGILSWEAADALAVEDDASLAMALNFVSDRVSEQFPRDAEEAIDAWRRLTENAGLDIRGALRRERLIPIILVSRQMSDEQSALLGILQDARDSFVFGATNSAVAMLRAVVERVVHKNYKVNGNSLYRALGEIGHLLPNNAGKVALRRIVSRANDILHHVPRSNLSQTPPDVRALELEVVGFFLTVRSLIESVAPQMNDAPEK